MKKTARYCCYVFGTILLLTALIFVLHNIIEDRKSGKIAEELLAELKEEIPEYTAPMTVLPQTGEYSLFEEYEERSVPEMEVIELDGKKYIGYITIPDLNIELPVMADWSYDSLKQSPCRYIGNIYSNDLVICAHNYNSHFGRLKNLSTGAEIVLTDVSGIPHRYSITSIETLSGTDIEDMQFGDSENWDLTLFTCTLSGQSRITVRAVKTQQ